MSIVISDLQKQIGFLEKGKSDYEIKKEELERKVRNLELELKKKSSKFTSDLSFYLTVIIKLHCIYVISKLK